MLEGSVWKEVLERSEYDSDKHFASDTLYIRSSTLFTLGFIQCR